MSNLSSIWVVTTGYNDYDQHGEYFVHAFDHRPSATELAEVLNSSVKHAEWVLSTGGGRKDVEYKWDYLIELKPGEIYRHRNGGKP